jgi:hypothetical protein
VVHVQILAAVHDAPSLLCHAADPSQHDLPDPGNLRLADPRLHLVEVLLVPLAVAQI